MKISATVVADSLSPQNKRLTSLILVYPRIIHSEFLTHRLFSRNAASSRAIPTRKMIEMIEREPFVPLAFQREHKGMQGYEYITDPNEIQREMDDWLDDRDYAIKKARGRIERKITKQLINRPLEPFQYYTTLVSGTEWSNFFKLRCPNYWFPKDSIYLPSRKAYIENIKNTGMDLYIPNDELSWLSINKGQAEIHMMALAEAIYDAINESKPKQLKAGGWHIPFEDKINNNDLWEQTKNTKVDALGNRYGFVGQVIKVSTAMAARTSYTVVGDEKEVSYETLLNIHDRIVSAKPMHSSPTEHCARAMNDKEYDMYTKSVPANDNPENMLREVEVGWCKNYQGWIQYRHILETQNKI